MTQNKKSYGLNEMGVWVAAVMVVAMFVAGMVYNKEYFKQHKQRQIEKLQSLKNIETIAFKQFSR